MRHMNHRTTINGERRLLSKSPIVVYVSGEIDESSFEIFSKQFVKAVACGQKIIPVVIHSSGGNVVEALGMTALMRGAPVPVATIVTAQAFSAAALVFTAGSPGYRYMGPMATLMLHDVSLVGISGTAQEVNAEARELTRVNELSFRHMSSNIGKDDENYLRDLVRAHTGDLYLTADQCLEHGICDNVGVPHLEVQLTAELRLVNSSNWIGTGVVMKVDTPALANVSGQKRKRTSDSDDESDDDD